MTAHGILLLVHLISFSMPRSQMHRKTLIGLQWLFKKSVMELCCFCIFMLANGLWEALVRGIK